MGCRGQVLGIPFGRATVKPTHDPQISPLKFQWLDCSPCAGEVVRDLVSASAYRGKQSPALPDRPPDMSLISPGGY